MFAKFASVLALVSIATAHFTLDYPPTRGFDEDSEDKFCNGIPTNATGRHAFPLSGPAPVTITATHLPWQLSLFVSATPDPTDFTVFNTSGSTNYLLPFTVGSVTGSNCVNIDFTTLTSKLNLKNGSLVTLQAEWIGGDGSLFQCSDLILTTEAATPSNETCAKPFTSATSTSDSGSHHETSTATMSMSAPSASASNSGASTILTSLGSIIVVALAVTVSV